MPLASWALSTPAAFPVGNAASVCRRQQTYSSWLQLITRSWMHSISTCFAMSVDRFARESSSYSLIRIMKQNRPRDARQHRLHGRYRHHLRQPGLTAKQIEAMRQHVILLAQTICEHV